MPPSPCRDGAMRRQWIHWVTPCTRFSVERTARCAQRPAGCPGLDRAGTERDWHRRRRHIISICCARPAPQLPLLGRTTSWTLSSRLPLDFPQGDMFLSADSTPRARPSRPRTPAVAICNWLYAGPLRRRCDLRGGKSDERLAILRLALMDLARLPKRGYRLPEHLQIEVARQPGFMTLSPGPPAKIPGRQRARDRWSKKPRSRHSGSGSQPFLLKKVQRCLDLCLREAARAIGRATNQFARRPSAETSIADAEVCGSTARRDRKQMREVGPRRPTVAGNSSLLGLPARFRRARFQLRTRRRRFFVALRLLRAASV